MRPAGQKAESPLTPSMLQPTGEAEELEKVGLGLVSPCSGVPNVTVSLEHTFSTTNGQCLVCRKI